MNPRLLSVINGLLSINHGLIWAIAACFFFGASWLPRSGPEYGPDWGLYLLPPCSSRV